MDSNQQNIITASSTIVQPLIETLVSLRDWSANSMQYVKRRNHLSANEKEDIFQRFEQYEYHFRKLIKEYREGRGEIEPGKISEEIEKHLQMQAKFNRYARYYEFPPYPLPDAILTAKALESCFKVTDETHNNVLFAGDLLKCKPFHSLADLKADSLVVVMYRNNYRSPRKVKVGHFSALLGNNLILKYDNPALLNKRSIWGISMYNVIHVFNAQVVYRDRE